MVSHTTRKGSDISSELLHNHKFQMWVSAWDVLQKGFQLSVLLILYKVQHM